MFTDPAYRRLFLAQTTSRSGDAFRTVALAIVVFQLTASGLSTAGVVAAEILPVLLLAAVAGGSSRPTAATHRHDRRRRVARGPHGAAPAGRLNRDAIAFGLSVGSVFFNPAAGSLIPVVVSERALVAANSGIWTAAVLAQIVLAPAAVGLVGRPTLGSLQTPPPTPPRR